MDIDELRRKESTSNSADMCSTIREAKVTDHSNNHIYLFGWPELGRDESKMCPQLSARCEPGYK
jgi:hypothetical protein